MSSIQSIYGVQTALSKGYQALSENKYLIEEFKKAYPGELEKVADTIGSEMANALMAVRVEPRFSAQKKMLDSLQEKLVSGEGKAEFEKILQKAEQTFNDVVGNGFKGIIYDNRVMVQKTTSLQNNEVAVVRDKLEEAYQQAQEEISNGYDPGFLMPGEILTSNVRRDQIAANTETSKVQSVAEEEINSQKVAEKKETIEPLTQEEPSDMLAAKTEETEIPSVERKAEEKTFQKDVSSYQKIETGDIVEEQRIFEREEFESTLWNLKRAQMQIKKEKLNAWYLQKYN